MVFNVLFSPELLIVVNQSFHIDPGKLLNQRSISKTKMRRVQTSKIGFNIPSLFISPNEKTGIDTRVVKNPVISFRISSIVNEVLTSFK